MTAIATSSTVVLASWNPLPVDNHNGIVRHYTIHVVENQTGIIRESNSTIESISIESLHPAYTYHISVAAVTIMRGPYSIVITVVTNEDGEIDISTLKHNWYNLLYSSLKLS